MSPHTKTRDHAYAKRKLYIFKYIYTQNYFFTTIYIKISHKFACNQIRIITFATNNKKNKS